MAAGGRSLIVAVVLGAWRLPAACGARQRGAAAPLEVQPRAWDALGVPWEASNIAGIGGDEDRAQRKAAAETEEAWQEIRHAPGLWVWRVEAFQMVAWNRSQYGKFHTGDSYVVLHIEEVGRMLCYQIFSWLGAESTADEMGTAAYKTVELDDLLDGLASQSREVQGKESSQFRAIFPALAYLPGGVDSGFHHVISSTFQARLFQVRVTQEGLVELETTLGRKSMNEGDSFVLDAGDKIYVYSGPEASPVEKYEALILAKRLADRRLGHCEVSHALDDRAWRLLGGEGPIPPASEGSDWIPPPAVEDGVLYKLHDTSHGLHMDEVGRQKLRKEMLDSNHLMILDHDTEIFLWAGKFAEEVERRNAFRTAFSFLKTNYRDLGTPIHMYREGNAINHQVWNAIFGH